MSGTRNQDGRTSTYPQTQLCVQCSLSLREAQWYAPPACRSHLALPQYLQAPGLLEVEFANPAMLRLVGRARGHIPPVQ